MTDKLDVDKLARECGFQIHELSGYYMGEHEELTAYTRAVMEECERAWQSIPQSDSDSVEFTAGLNAGIALYIDAIRRLMP